VKTDTERIAELVAWVNDLQSGMYINCVYCGHRYGPSSDTPVAMADVLKTDENCCALCDDYCCPFCIAAVALREKAS
jgi:hypothetical protein